MGVKVLRAPGRPSTMQRLIESSLKGVAEDFIEWQIQNDRVASGRSKNWFIKLKRIGNLKPKDVVGNLLGVSYINYALFGRRAGKAPKVSHILQWMRIRGIRGRDLGGRFRSDREAAYAIARQIGEIGTKAKRMPIILQDAIYTRNLNRAAKEFTPIKAQETADSLIDGFIEAIGDVQNIQVVKQE